MGRRGEQPFSRVSRPDATGSAVGITFDDPALEASILASLDTVEAPARGRHLGRPGAQRGRPAPDRRGRQAVPPLLVALAAQFGDPAAPRGGAAAVVVELTHLATLYHDDVMDEAPVRRGAASANARWGNSIAILTGDYLFARAADIAADLGPEAVRIQARTFARLVRGQIAETVGPRDADPVEHHLRVITDKTGSLIGTVGAVRRHVQRRRTRPQWRPWPRTATPSASPSSSPTTCWTSPPSRAESGQDPRHRPA